MDTALNPLAGLGYTTREAAFIRLIALNSGVFMRRHFLALAGSEYGKADQVLIEKLLRQRHARPLDFYGKPQIYRLVHKAIYRAVGAENSNNRKACSPTLIKSRLMGLDLILAHAEAKLLETEAEKIRFFVHRYGLSEDDLPWVEYRAAQRSAPPCRRWFVEKFPIFLTGEQANPLVNFSFVNDGQATVSNFVNFLRRYHFLLARLKCFRLYYVGENAETAVAARGHFEKFCGRNAPPQPLVSGRLLRYFRLLRGYREQSMQFTNALYQEMVRLGKEFPDSEYAAQYQAWAEADRDESGAMPGGVSLSRSAPVVASGQSANGIPEFVPFMVGSRYAFLSVAVLGPPRSSTASSRGASPAASPATRRAPGRKALEIAVVTPPSAPTAQRLPEQPAEQPPAGNDPVVTGFGSIPGEAPLGASPGDVAKVPARQDRA